MSSFFNLRLDTTPPSTQLNLPSYVGDNETYIELVATEELDDFHEILIRDSGGQEKSLTFTVEGDTISGILDVTGLFPGMTTIYIRLYDRAWNKSELIQGSFEILETSKNKIKTDLKEAPLGTSFNTKKIIITLYDMSIEEELMGSGIVEEIIDRKNETTIEKKE